MSRQGAVRILPNVISLARLIAVPVTVYLILLEAFVAAFWLFVVAGVSDALDGAIAKYCDAVTELGKYLDPLADKALLVACYVALGFLGHLPLWLVILVVFRDIVIIGGAILYQTLTQSLKMEPLFISKINTVAQILLAGFLLGDLAFGLALDGLIGLLISAVAATTLLSGGVYMFEWAQRSMANGRRHQ